MAWIMKNSATMDIGRRAEPYLGESLKAELERDLMPRYPTRLAASLPILRRVQEEHGWIPFQAIEEAAAFIGISAADLYDTATFYEEFFLEPGGKYVVWVCQSIACELVGHMDLIEKLRDKLGIEPGETTEDGRFSLMTVECLGSCGTAPVALVNHTLHENLTPENIDRVIDELE